MQTKPLIALAAGAVMAVSVVSVGIAQSNMASLVKQRQESMGLMGRNMGAIGRVVRGEEANVAAAATAAAVVNENAKKILTEFPAGSGRDAVAESRARPEVWSQRAEFEAAANRLIAESGKFSDVAKGGNLEAMKTAYATLGQACGGCHEARGAAGGKYRFEKQ
ncbi:MAG: cytochrome c [Rhodospirillales bacterium]